MLEKFNTMDRPRPRNDYYHDIFSIGVTARFGLLSNTIYGPANASGANDRRFISYWRRPSVKINFSGAVARYLASIPQAKPQRSICSYLECPFSALVGRIKKNAKLDEAWRYMLGISDPAQRLEIAEEIVRQQVLLAEKIGCEHDSVWASITQSFRVFWKGKVSCSEKRPLSGISCSWDWRTRTKNQLEWYNFCVCEESSHAVWPLCVSCLWDCWRGTMQGGKLDANIELYPREFGFGIRFYLINKTISHPSTWPSGWGAALSSITNARLGSLWCFSAS